MGLEELCLEKLENNRNMEVKGQGAVKTMSKDDNSMVSRMRTSRLWDNELCMNY